MLGLDRGGQREEGFQPTVGNILLVSIQTTIFSYNSVKTEPTVN